MSRPKIRDVVLDVRTVTYTTTYTEYQIRCGRCRIWAPLPADGNVVPIRRRA